MYIIIMFHNENKEAKLKKKKIPTTFHRCSFSNVSQRSCRATSFRTDTHQELSISLDPLTDCRTFSSTSYSTVSGRDSALIKQTSLQFLRV